MVKGETGGWYSRTSSTVRHTRPPALVRNSTIRWPSAFLSMTRAPSPLLPSMEPLPIDDSIWNTNFLGAFMITSRS
jgi:hypothetical protein